MIQTFTPLNLSKVPHPVLIELSGFEDILRDTIDDHLTRNPDAETTIFLESDPARKLLETTSYREMVLVSKINSQTLGNTLAFGTGVDLDNRAANLLMVRLPGEDDETLRARIQLAPEGYSTAGPRGAYVFHAKSADADITDVFIDTFDLREGTAETAEAIALRAEIFEKMAQYAALTGQPLPGVVDTYVLTKQDVVSPSVLNGVEAALNADHIRPVTDLVVVKPFSAEIFVIDARLVMGEGPDSAVVIAAAKESLAAYLSGRRKFGRAVTRAGLLGALVVDGVENVELLSPAADIAVGAAQVAIASSVSVTEANNV